MFYQDFLYVCLTAFVSLSCGILVRTVASVLSKGLKSRSAFEMMWVFAYAVPTLVYLLSPKAAAGVEGIAWMGIEEWGIAALMALVGLACFELGYHLGRRRVFTGRGTSQVAVIRSNRFAQFTLLFVSLGLQIYPIYLIRSRGIRIDFVHRAVHWQQVGLAIRLAYFSLPAMAVALWLFLDRKSLLRLVLLLLTFVISTVSAVILGARMFLVLLPFVLFLVYSTRRPKTRVWLFAMLFVMALLVSVVYQTVLRSDDPGSFVPSLVKVIMSDLGRMHTLAYTGKHIGLIRSDLVTPPILGSYFYWLILPVPRSTWPGKPYATNLQFSFHFRHEHTSFYVPPTIAEMAGSTEFGFIEEAALNLGVMGLFILILFGYLAARLDGRIHHTRYLKVVVPVFFLVGTIYTFNGVLNYLAPFVIVSFFLDRVMRRQVKEHRRVARFGAEVQATR